MTLIKCPSCNHTILSLASRCPSCGFHLTQERFQQGPSGSLAECRKCGRKVLSKTRECPYCGARHPARSSRTGLVLGAAGAVGVFLLLAVAARQLAPGPEVPEAGGEGVILTAPGGEDLPAREPGEGRSEPISAPGVEAQPEASRAGEPAVPALLRVADSFRAAPAGSVLPVGGVTRWLSNWANVREGRGLESPILRVLPPGREVVVANRVSGWWEVYLDHRFIGYVAGSLLLDQPPDTLVPRR